MIPPNDTPMAHPIDAAPSRNTLDRSRLRSAPSNTQPESPTATVLNIPVENLRPSAAQPRHWFDDESLVQLSKSIEHYGILQPLIVKPTSSNCFEILAGERRWRAAKLAQLKQVPCLVRQSDDDDCLEVALIENLQRQDLTPIEEAQALADLISHHHYTHEVLSSRIGMPRTTISNSLRLLQLSESIKEKLNQGLMSSGHAKAILTLPQDSQREMLAALVVHKGLSVRRTEQMAKAMISEKTAAPSQRALISPNLRHLCDQYKGHLGTKVKITGDHERGRIEISYYSQEDLDRITELVIGSELP
jgi:ParB family chromosome partitioning protein